MSGITGSRQPCGQQVRPEPYVEKSFVESFTGFIQGTTGTTVQNEDKEKILWLKFDDCDLTNVAFSRRQNLGRNPPLVLIIGYAKGVQVWMIPEGGVAVELLSYRQGAVKCFKILSSPDLLGSTLLDEFSLKRPLAALCDASSNYQTVVIQSLKTGEQVNRAMKFAAPVEDLHANKKVLVVAFPTDLAIFSAIDLEELFKVTCCYPRGDSGPNPVALGSAWMAFADSKLYHVHQSKGGVCSEAGSTYKSTVIHAAKSLTQGLLGLGGTVASNLMGQSSSPPAPSIIPRAVPGIVTVVALNEVKQAELNLEYKPCTGVVCHFEAHPGSPIACMQFGGCGMLLATADENGHMFNIFKLWPNDRGLDVVQHLYTLKRGDTTAKILSMSFTIDNRWISVSTHRGTTHVFPITPYGGSIEARTHITPFVVNRLSNFQLSIGIKESEAGYSVSSRTESPIAKQMLEPHGTTLSQQYACSGTVVVEPLAQLKQAMLLNIIESLANQSPSNSPPTNSRRPSHNADDIQISCRFGSRRSHLDVAGKSGSKQECPNADALFVALNNGVVIEYDLKPKHASRIPIEKRSDTNPIELCAEPIGQWSLLRELANKEIRPTLHNTLPYISLTNERLNDSNQEPPTDKEVGSQWKSEIECSFYTGPNRKIWMGPQFQFISSANDEQRKDLLPHDTSSPVFVNISSLSTSSDQSHRFGSSLESESEEVRNKVKSELADAIMDVEPLAYSAFRNHSRNCKEDLDDDIFDMNWDPTSPSLRPSSTCSEGTIQNRVEADYLDMTNKLQKVGILDATVYKERHPLWGAHTPTLDECRAMTSSAEELSATLSISGIASNFHSNWQPIDPPVLQREMNHPLLERPKPLDRRVQDNIMSPVEMEAPLSYQCSSAWSKVTEKCTDPENDFGEINLFDQQMQSPKEFGSKNVSSSSTSALSLSIKSSATSANTSEDDFGSREIKNGRRKRKKRNKIEVEKEEVATILVDTKEVRMGGIDVTKNYVPLGHLCSFEGDELVDLDADNFHSAKEYHDLPGEEYHDTGETTDCFSFNRLEDLAMASDDELEQCSGVEIISSIHDENDLAKALEEASSDDSRPVYSSTKLNNEIFPFRDVFSDEEGAGHVYRRGANFQNYCDDDEYRLLSDDRKTTSESDVTTSPSSHAASVVRGKKKKKKRK